MRRSRSTISAHQSVPLNSTQPSYQATIWDSSPAGSLLTSVLSQHPQVIKANDITHITHLAKINPHLTSYTSLRMTSCRSSSEPLSLPTRECERKWVSFIVVSCEWNRWDTLNTSLLMRDLPMLWTELSFDGQTQQQLCLQWGWEAVCKCG